MGLFTPNYLRNGPGVPVDAPRKKGLARLFEVLGRDIKSFYIAGLLALASALPYAMGLTFAVQTRSILPLMAAGLLGGLLLGPQLSGLMDTILRSMRDEPGYFWATYRRAWKQNVRASLVPGMLCGLALAGQIFSLCLFRPEGVLFGVAVAVGLFLTVGLTLYLFVQIPLMDMPFPRLLLNAALLLVGNLPGSLKALAAVLVYALLCWLFYPLTLLVLPLTLGLWFPLLLAVMGLYPGLDRVLHIEEKIKALREKQLQDE